MLMRKRTTLLFRVPKQWQIEEKQH
jgi:hypothetical protein